MTSTRLAGLSAMVFAVASCNDAGRPAHGTASSLIIVAADSLWEEIGTEVEAALEPRIFTVRDEATFDVTHISPADPAWSDLRRFKQVLPIGRPGDFWVEPALDDGAATTLPAIVETQDVWARGQGVTAIVLPDDDPAGAVRTQLGDLGALLDRRFRSYALSRMFVSQPDTALQTALRGEAGFSLLLPNVYRRTDLDETQVFRHHAELGGVLMRTLAVAWRPGAVAPSGSADVLAWRDSLSAYAYDLEQRADTARVETRELPGGILEVQGVWNSVDPSWPAAGPFIDRVVPCPSENRTYIIDAWLFAPGKKKYEYMIQLETILDSFRCGDAAPAPPLAGG